MKNEQLGISVVVPVKDEEATIKVLLESLENQTVAPAEIVIVDGGSIDNTRSIVENAAKTKPKIKLRKAERASPGRGRNLGIEASANDWIALTDAGIALEHDWLEQLCRAAGNFLGDESQCREIQEGAWNPGPAIESDSYERPVDIVYGNYAPLIRNLFEKCAVFAYVPPQLNSGIRSKFIASCLLRKDVWTAIGGFPDLRAAEDLIFIDRAKELGMNESFAPSAMVHWQLRPNLKSTFHKFSLYSKFNVWAGRQGDWHYGILKNYLILTPFILLSVVHSFWWLAFLPLWLGARTGKRIFAHRYEFGIAPLFDPRVILVTGSLLLLIDLATFTGWAKALASQPEYVD